MEDQVQQMNIRKRVRASDSDSSELDSAEVKRLREDLLELLDDTDLDPVNQDLASVMRSFEEELSTPPVTVVDLTSDSDDSPPELGFLLGASDDDLGLPPSSSSGSTDGGDVAEILRPPFDSAGLCESWGFDSFDDQIPSYDDSFGSVPFELVAYDNGLFQYEDGCFDAADYSDFSWRTE